MKKLLVIDGNSILNRAFYGVKPLTTKDGFPTNALYGFVNMIARQADRLEPDYCAVAFDLKAPTFRHLRYGAYKAGRKPMPEELALQLPVAKELLSAMGYHVLALEGYEADDILGTLADLAERENVEAFVMTGDRDSLQLISKNTHVLLTTNADTIDMTEEAFFAKYGVASSQFVDVKALMGDSSDNIPGVPGIGEKTALRLIAEYGSLNGVYETLPTAKHTPSQRQKLENGRESAYLSRELAQICREVPLGLSLEDLACKGVQRAELRALFLRLEFAGFLKRFGLDSAEPAVAEKVEEIGRFRVSREELCKRIEAAKLVGLEAEERLLWLVNGHVLESDASLSSVSHALVGKTVICYDCKSLYKRPELADLKKLKVFDLMLGGYLANSSKSNYSLKTLVGDYLATVLTDDIPAIVYYEKLYDAILEQLTADGQEQLMETLEMPLALVLADMEEAGFRIDRQGIEAYGEQLGAIAAALEAQIHMQAGKVFNVNSPKQLGEVLFETLGLPHEKKTKTGYSTNAEILERLRPYHPIVQDILDYRQVTKLKSTYTDGLLKVADENGRIHSTFKQTGTATGRLSSSDPNLQNIPIRTEMGRELRRYFLPENDDYVIIDADYSQIELRLLAHVSEDKNMTEAFLSGADIHTSTAATVFGVAPDRVTSDMRKKAKAVNFGILYGIGAFSLSDDLGVSRAQAQSYIDQYLAGFPQVDAYLKNTIARAYECGYVTTVFGRRRYIPELKGKNKVQQKFGERVAMNSPIQGAAADLIKLAMIRVHRRLREEGLDARLILQVHDELLIEANKSCAEQASRILQEEMESAARLNVPLTVEIHAGKNWFEAK
ncbi:MAG: DNA polymerase I [Ruminococcaceae bacterium]|nr:DNA polymerase I [Oscillospiraceae bacterium]